MAITSLDRIIKVGILHDIHTGSEEFTSLFQSINAPLDFHVYEVSNGVRCCVSGNGLLTVEYRRSVLVTAYAGFARTIAFEAVRISHHVLSYLVASCSYERGML